MPIKLSDLPYGYDALEPHISKQTLEFHHNKHHQTYVTNLNKFIINTPLDSMNLETIIKTTVGDSEKTAIFNNAAQIWNHTFYWHCMKSNGGGHPTGLLAEKIKISFGSYEKFVEKFKVAATTQFGSGWAWLVINKEGHLKIMKTSNADLPLAHGQKALLTIDVWEHAYYLDYQNRRPDYINVFLKHLVNWDYVNSLL